MKAFIQLSAVIGVSMLLVGCTSYSHERVHYYHGHKYMTNEYRYYKAPVRVYKVPKHTHSYHYYRTYRVYPAYQCTLPAC